MYEINQAVLDTIHNRKSVRDFLEQPVEPEKLQAIYDAILTSPTTENMMMYTVLSIVDPELRLRLSKQPAIKKAPVVLVFCADYRRWNILFQGMSDTGRPPQEGEYQLALIDAVLAAHNGVLAAEGLGLSSVYLGDIMEHYEERAQILGLPAGVVPVLTLCLGYATPAQLSRPAVRRYTQHYIIHENRYRDFTRGELLEMVQERGQYESSEHMEQWLQRFAHRCVDGKGAVERTRSIRAALDAWNHMND